MVGPVGPLATISREPGQARKGAAAAVTSCAGVWLAGSTSSSAFSLLFQLSLLMLVACACSAIALQQSVEFTALLQSDHGPEDFLCRDLRVVPYQAGDGLFLNDFQGSQRGFFR